MFCNIAMRDLRQRMHAGVGAARAMHAYMLAQDRLDRGFQRALYGGAIVLDLPAAERPTVIFDCQLVAGHIDPARTTSPAKADDPVFSRVSLLSRGPRRTGWPACAGYDNVSRGTTVLCKPHRRLQRRAAQELLRLHRLLTGALQFENPQCALLAGK